MTPSTAKYYNKIKVNIGKISLLFQEYYNKVPKSKALYRIKKRNNNILTFQKFVTEYVFIQCVIYLNNYNIN